MKYRAPLHVLPIIRGITLLALLAVVVWIILQSFRRAPYATNPEGLHEFTGQTMGSTYSVKVVVPPERWAAIAENVGPAIQAELDLVNGRMSTYRPDSELSRFNQFAETTPFSMSRETIEVFQLAQQVSEASGGAFDVTVGPLVNAWGFGPEERSLQGPSDEELAKLRERVGYHMLEIDAAASTVRKARPDIYCDLGAVAPGYAVDRVAEALERLGINNYMIEVGGEVRTRGDKGGGGWHIGIERPESGFQEAIYKRIAMSPEGMAMATSGDYRNYYEVAGVRLSHTIDPKTGRPIAHHLASVTVLAATCAVADAYATAINVLGPEKGYDLAVNQQLAALLIIRTDTDQYTEKATPAFAQ